MTTQTWGHEFDRTTRLNIVSTNAAVFPVPLCDCAIMFVGLHAHILNKVSRFDF